MLWIRVEPSGGLGECVETGIKLLNTPGFDQMAPGEFGLIMTFNGDDYRMRKFDTVESVLTHRKPTKCRSCNK